MVLGDGLVHVTSMEMPIKASSSACVRRAKYGIKKLIIIIISPRFLIGLV